MRASSDAGNKWCPACGGELSRGTARYCSDCGKLLTEGYEPLDTIRASYRLQRTNLEMDRGMEMKSALFEGETSGTSQTAWACVVYSMVPYLGILFIPLAFAVSGVGYLTVSKNVARNRRITGICFGLSAVILVVQIGLWWLLYLIPTLAQGSPISN
jgi:hypothetical protein